VIDFVYPPECAGCGKPGVLFCEDCLRKVKHISLRCCPICGNPGRSTAICENCCEEKPSFSALRSWGEYSEPLRGALHTLKYRNNLGLARVFTPMLVEIVKSQNWELDAVLPVPLCRSHSKERGFNQSELLAYPLALELGLPLLTHAITRVKETSSQVSLDRESRFKNLEGAFVGNPATLKERSVLLVDDTVTTGATLVSCSKALLDSGCRSVFCITVAKALKKHHQTL
jgi:competence protein ComFC